jgi:hypothetical protein
VCSKKRFGPAVCRVLNSLRSDSRALSANEAAAKASQSRRVYRIRQGWGCVDGIETRTVRHFRIFFFLLASLPVAVAPPLVPASCAASAARPRRLLLSLAVARLALRPFFLTFLKWGPVARLSRRLFRQLVAPSTPCVSSVGRGRPCPCAPACALW